MKILKEMITSEDGTIEFTCIIVDSIKDHIIPHVSSLNTPKEMFDSLTKLFEGKNINQKKYRNSVILEEIDLDQYFSI